MALLELICKDKFTYNGNAVATCRHIEKRLSEKFVLQKVSSNQHELIFKLEQDSVIFRNAFLPMITVKLEVVSENETKVNISMRLKKLIGVFVYIYIAFAMLFQLLLLSLVVYGSYSFTATLLIPLALMIFTMVFACGGLKVFSMYVMKTIRKTGDGLREPYCKGQGDGSVAHSTGDGSMC